MVGVPGAFSLEGAYQLAWQERECPSPNPPPTSWELPAQLLLSPTLVLLTCLSQPLPTQLGCPSFTLQAVRQDCGPLALCL